MVIQTDFNMDKSPSFLENGACDDCLKDGDNMLHYVTIIRGPAGKVNEGNNLQVKLGIRGSAGKVNEGNNLQVKQETAGNN